MRTSLIIMFCITLFHQTFAQSGNSFKGQVYCSQTNKPVEFAAVQLKQLNGNYIGNEISNEKGKFQFKNIPDGYYTLTCKFLAYNTFTSDSLELKRNIDFGAIKITPEEISIGETTITADRNAVDFKLDKQVINVSQQLNAQGGTAADALQAVPSIQVDAEGNVTLRGSTDFTLLIDGRPTVLEAADILNQMQAENIQCIEVITNPSAKYEAEGNTGIINIVTKKSYLKGTEALINLSVANGNKYAANVALNKSFNKARIFAGISYSDKTKINDNRAERNVFEAEPLTERIDDERQIRYFSTEFNVGADFYLNPKNTLSINAQSGNWEFNRTILSDYTSNNDINIIKTDEKFSNNNKYVSGSLNFEHVFENKEHILNLDVFYKYLDNETPGDYAEYSTDYFQKIENNALKKQIRIKLDYVRPVSKIWKLEGGLFYDNNHSDYHYNYFHKMDIQDNWQKDETLSDLMNYEQFVFAGYLTLSAELKPFNLQIGLRGEGNQIELQTLAEVYDYSKFDLFPTIHISKILKEKHNLSFSYSRRINRPSEWQLSPLVYSSDIFMIKQGNPYLLPEFTNSVELNYYVKNKKWNLNMQLFYRDLNNSISSFVLYRDSFFLETYENLKNTTNCGAEIMLGYNPLKWLRLSTGFSAYYSNWQGVLSDQNQLKNSSLVGNGNFRSTFIISKNTSLQFMAIYYAPGETPQGHIDAFYYFDFILRQQLLDKNLSLTLRTHNTFDTGLLHYTTTGNNYFSQDWYHYEGPTFIFSLSYKLNNFKQRKSQEKVKVDFDSGLDH